MLVICCSCKQQHNEKRLASAYSPEISEENTQQGIELAAGMATGCYTNKQLAIIAKEKSTGQEVKALAAVLEIQQDSLLQQLKKYMAERGYSLPLTEERKDKRTAEELIGEDPKEFDRTWCSKMRNRYQETVKMYERAAVEKTTDTGLINWINRSLPSIRSSLNRLLAMEKSLQ
ncbi:MAG: DUF4142 domain-containing protein [Chitinophagaceae bacterium]